MPFDRNAVYQRGYKQEPTVRSMKVSTERLISLCKACAKGKVDADGKRLIQVTHYEGPGIRDYEIGHSHVCAMTLQNKAGCSLLGKIVRGCESVEEAAFLVQRANFDTSREGDGTVVSWVIFENYVL